jgi:hypothetical protein
LHSLEEAALEGPATRRPIGVNTAKLPFQSGTGLRQETLLSWSRGRKAKGLEEFRRILVRELQVRENNSVAAHAAGRAKLRGGFSVRNSWVHRHGRAM